MTRVSLYFDGKNHMKDLRAAAGDRWVQHGALADFVVAAVGGDVLAAAHYYTGVPHDDDGGARRALGDLLRDLEALPGFFIHRFKRHGASWTCPRCGHNDPYTREKCVDTSIVVDLVLDAVHDAYDIAVVLSADLDLEPGIVAARKLGKRVWVAHFGQLNVPRGLARAAWSTLDLSAHLEAFAKPALGAAPPAEGDAGPMWSDADVLRELRRAELHFGAGGGFVGAHYFVHRWRGHDLPESPDGRRIAVERLIHAGLIETYEMQGKAALRTVGEVLLPELEGQPGRPPIHTGHAGHTGHAAHSGRLPPGSMPAPPPTLAEHDDDGDNGDDDDVGADA